MEEQKSGAAPLDDDAFLFENNVEYELAGNGRSHHATCMNFRSGHFSCDTFDYLRTRTF